MLRRINALVWLRNQILISNKNLSIQMLLPYMLLLLYKKFMDASGMTLMFVCLSMAISMSVGGMISTIIAEEKEKNMLKTLLLSGVRYNEYILSVLIHPVLITVITMILFPILTESKLDGLYLEYIVVTALTSLIVMLINMSIGLLSSTQAKAQVNALPITFLVALLPMFASTNESLNEFVDYTFMSAYTRFFNNTNFSLNDQSIKVLVIWNIALLVLSYIAIKKSKKLGESKMKVKSNHLQILPLKDKNIVIKG